MLSKYFYLLVFLLINVGIVSANISIPQAVNADRVSEITFDFESYYDYIYFYEADNSNNVYRLLYLGCDGPCSGQMSVDYAFPGFDTGDYKIKVYSYESNIWESSNLSVVEPCDDNTPVFSCSVKNVGKFCNFDSVLVDGCQNCGCPSGFECSENGACTLEIEIGPNEKNMDFYSDKMVFLISDKDWIDALQLVSVSTWTGEENCKNGYGTAQDVCVYPTLVYSEYGNSFDADSIIDFINAYDADSAILVGSSPYYLDSLLVQNRDFGAGIPSENLVRIYSKDYLSYWESFDTVVYVEQDYEKALLASTYASLRNAPLVIEGSHTDSSDVFIGRNVICVGDVSPVSSGCAESYNLQGLQNQYKSETNTDKVILVNPSDWDTGIQEYFYPDRGGYIGKLYLKASLIAPILASAKHELLLSTRDTDYSDIDNYLESRLSGINYLTIMASGWVIPNEAHRVSLVGHDFSWALDASHYADTNGDNSPDLAVGRISGISSSDVSAYVSRVLFYDSLERSDSVTFLASSFNGVLKGYTQGAVNLFESSGYNVVDHLVESESYQFQSSEWENQDMIFYSDHGAQLWAGIFYYDIPKLSNTFIITAACYTTSTFDRYSFWAHAMRKGSIGFIGSVSETFVSLSYYDVLNKIYRDGDSRLGDAYTQSYEGSFFEAMMALMGDPTFDFAQSKELVGDVSSGLCMVDGFPCVFNGDCCGGLECSWFTCDDCNEKNDGCAFNGDCCGDLKCSWFKCDDCGESGSGCLTNSDCCNDLRCGLFTCKDCKPDNELCLFDGECCSGDCSFQVHEMANFCCWGRWYEPWKCGFNSNNCGTWNLYGPLKDCG